VFADAQSAASAVAYISARLTLLSRPAGCICHDAARSRARSLRYRSPCAVHA
jgi:hypothetical protein